MTEPDPKNLVLEVDLKWSLWTLDASYWPPGHYLLLQKAFRDVRDERINSFTVHTAPRKEIRFGTVTFASDHRWLSVKVSVGFCEHWDETHDILDDFDLVEDQEVYSSLDQLIPSCCRCYDGDNGVDSTITFKARSFAAAMKRIDKHEEKLMRDSGEAWETVQQAIEEARKEKKSGRRDSEVQPLSLCSTESHEGDDHPTST